MTWLSPLCNLLYGHDHALGRLILETTAPQLEECGASWDEANGSRLLSTLGVPRTELFVVRRILVFVAP